MVLMVSIKLELLGCFQCDKCVCQLFFWIAAFDQDIGMWNVSNVTNMMGMFALASSLSQDIMTWNLSSATNMAMKFRDGSSFKQDIGPWDVSKVTDMTTT
jgi:surface protein